MKISLVTVTFNSEATLTDTIESVLLQTYSNVEYIVVDGLSIDNTVNIIKQYEPLFQGRMKWISEKDSSLYEAMNKGIKMASGDLIGLLNSDDFFTSNNILERIVYEFNNNEIDALYGDVHFVDSKNINKIVRYYSSKIFRKSLMKIGFMPAHPSFYTKRECFNKFGLYKTDYKICADFDLLLRFIYVNGVSIKYVPLDMVTMRMGGASTNGLRSHFQIMKEHLRSFKENNVRSNVLLLSTRYLYKLTEYFSINWIK